MRKKCRDAVQKRFALVVMVVLLAGGCASTGQAGGGGGEVQFRPVPQARAQSRSLTPPVFRERQVDAASEATIPPSEMLPRGWPIEHPSRLVISPFGRRGRRDHSGADIKGPRGIPVYATAAGVVKFAGTMRGYGRLVVVDHGNGVETAYGHLQTFNVKAGDTVGSRALLGALGNSGNATTYHVHYEIRLHGRPVDPVPFLD